MCSKLPQKAAIIAVAAAFFSAGCSKPESKPQQIQVTAADLDKMLHPPNVDLSQLPQPRNGAPHPNDTQMKTATDKLLADFAEHLKHEPPMISPPSAETYALANQKPIAVNNPPAATAPATAIAPASVYVASIDELTKLIRKSGFDPHPADPGMLPYFDALPNTTSDEAGIPSKLRIFYVLIDHNKIIYFIARIRKTREGEEPSPLKILQASGDSDKLDKLFAPELIRKLQAANPAPDTTWFAVRSLPSGGMNGVQVVQPTIIVEGGFYNPSPDPNVIIDAVSEMILVLHATKDIWK
jgi:hypothetical protein